MLDTEWSGGLRDAFRIELRAEAIGLAGRGWPVLPGTHPEISEHSDSYTTGPVPVYDDWQDRLDVHPDDATAIWTAHPHALLVATGRVLDAIEVDAVLGQRAAALLRVTGQPTPIAATPDGRWLFLTDIASDLPVELSASARVRWHGLGSFIPLPPTPARHGIVHWRVKPGVWGWRLPRPEVVHDVLVHALSGEAAGVPARHDHVARRAENVQQPVLAGVSAA